MCNDNTLDLRFFKYLYPTYSNAKQLHYDTQQTFYLPITQEKTFIYLRESDLFISRKIEELILILILSKLLSLLWDVVVVVVVSNLLKYEADKKIWIF